MKYGKLIDGRIKYAPNPLRSGGYDIFNPSLEQYTAEGYKQVMDTPYPSDGKTYEGSWTETEAEIKRIWTEVPTPTPEPSEIDKLRSDVDYIAMCTEVDLDEAF